MEENGIENKKEITHMHFLVHPGWVIIYEKNIPKEFLEYLKDLLRRYVEKASTLKPNELMVIFSPTIGIKFQKDFKEKSDLYVDTIKKIKRILGNRLIVLADSGEEKKIEPRGAIHSENKEMVWDKIKTIAQKRGLILSKQLTAEAYGELMEACVRKIAENIHKASGMSKENPIKINANLTDYPLLITQNSDTIERLRGKGYEYMYFSNGKETLIDFSEYNKNNNK